MYGRQHVWETRSYRIGELVLDRVGFLVFCHELRSPLAMEEAIRSTRVEDILTYDGDVVEVSGFRLIKDELEVKNLLRVLEDAEYIEMLKREVLDYTIEFERASCKNTYRGFKTLPFSRKIPKYPLDKVSSFYLKGLKPIELTKKKQSF